VPDGFSKDPELRGAELHGSPLRPTHASTRKN
jgi:hypothetical protein